MTVELRVLGSLRLSATDGRDLESLLRQPKRTALLAYLAAAVPRGFRRRDTLLSLFWPELDDAHARAALNQALYVLRNALGEQALMTRGDGEVGLGGDVVWCDAAAGVPQPVRVAGRARAAAAHVPAGSRLRHGGRGAVVIRCTLYVVRRTTYNS